MSNMLAGLKSRPLVTFILVGVVVVLLVISFVVSWVMSFGSSGAIPMPQGTPEATQQATPEATLTSKQMLDAQQAESGVIVPPTQTDALTTGISPMSTPTATGPYQDVTYNGLISEMPVANGQTITCNFANGDVVSVTNKGDTLHITGTTPVLDITVFGDDILAVDSIDNKGNGDGWVKVVPAGNMSVYFDPTIGWKADWLIGCPLPLKTPGP